MASKAKWTPRRGVVQNAVSLLDQARSLAAQGASATLSPSGANARMAAQAEQILNALIDDSRATFDGQYLFSGDSSSQPAYDCESRQRRTASTGC